MLGLQLCPHVHPVNANNKLAEINVVLFISRFSPKYSVVTLAWCTFRRTTLRQHSGCANKDRKIFAIEKVFLTLRVVFRCYSCSAMD